MNIKDMQRECLEIAISKGWEANPQVPEQIALICSEACEGLEYWREGKPITFTREDGKPEGLASEYADVIIRIGHYAEAMGIDLESEISRKLRYNRTREYRHGHKLA